MRTGQKCHAAVFDGDIAQGEPAGNRLVRMVVRPIRLVLMKFGRFAVVRFFNQNLIVPQTQIDARQQARARRDA